MDYLDKGVIPDFLGGESVVSLAAGSGSQKGAGQEPGNPDFWGQKANGQHFRGSCPPSSGQREMLALSGGSPGCRSFPREVTFLEVGSSFGSFKGSEGWRGGTAFKSTCRA